jgi:hypothetical protein
MLPEGDERPAICTVPASDADRSYCNNDSVMDEKHSEMELPEETRGNGASIPPLECETKTRDTNSNVPCQVF